MPSRYIRSDYLDSDTVAKASDAGEVMFFRLALVVDDFGRFDGRLNVIARKCWPLGTEGKDPGLEEIERRLQHLDDIGLIVRYEVDGKPYVFIPKFHQRTRAQKSKYPNPPMECLTGARQVTGKRQTDDRQVTDKSPADDGLERVRVRVRVREQPPVDKSAPPVDNPPKAKKPQVFDDEPDEIEDPEPTPQPKANGTATRAPGAPPPTDWEESTDGIVQAASHLGMKRLPFESDDQLAQRVNARLALG